MDIKYSMYIPWLSPKNFARGGPSDPPAGGRGENYKKNREKGLKNAYFRVINSQHFDGDLHPDCTFSVYSI